MANTELKSKGTLLPDPRDRTEREISLALRVQMRSLNPTERLGVALGVLRGNLGRDFVRGIPYIGEQLDEFDADFNSIEKQERRSSLAASEIKTFGGEDVDHECG